MDVRLLTWSAALISGVLITGTGVHYFRCNTEINFVQYSDQSVLQYYCPVPTNSHDLILSVPVEKPDNLIKVSGDQSSWGQLPNEASPISLRQHNVHKQWISLSGFSSGGSFAQQLQISYSSLFSGIATFNHAYYRCGPGTGTEVAYDDACTLIGNNATYNPDLALADIRDYERQGLIEPTSNLRNKRLYVYAGTRSTFFDLDLSLAVVRIYEPFIQNLCNIKTRVQDASQVMPTANFGKDCREEATLETYFLGNCGFSGALEALSFLLGNNIHPPTNGFKANMRNLMAFDQTEFFYGFEGNHSMDSVGYIFVPPQCYHTQCFLHFYFHGCFTGREFNGTSHLINSGYLEVAEANNLIIVAPQALASLPENEIGCWDTYGITGRLYATQRGPQVRVVRNILARILGEDNRISQQNRRGGAISFDDHSSFIYDRKHSALNGYH